MDISLPVVLSIAIPLTTALGFMIRFTYGVGQEARSLKDSIVSLREMNEAQVASQSLQDRRLEDLGNTVMDVRLAVTRLEERQVSQGRTLERLEAKAH